MKITNQNISFKAAFENKVKEDILSKKDINFIKKEVDKMGTDKDIVVLNHLKAELPLKEPVILDHFKMSFISNDNKRVITSDKQTSGRTEKGITYAIKSNIAELKENLGLFDYF